MKIIVPLLLMFCSVLFSHAQVPANDLCVNAISLTCGSSLSGNTTNATNDALPSPACVGSATGYGNAKGVWYKITPAFSGTVSISTCTGTNWDTYLRVYEGSCGAFVSCKGYADDECLRQSIFEFSATANTTYYILLGGYSELDFGAFTITASCTNSCIPPSVVQATNISSISASITWSSTGNMIVEYGATGFTPGTGASAGVGGTAVATSTNPLSIGGLTPVTTYDVYVRRNCGSGNFSNNSAPISFTTTVPPPPNDVCGGALAISTVPLATSSAGATQSTAAITCNGSTASTAKDVWFKFTASASTAVISIANSQANFDAVVQAYRGSCSGTLTSLACADATAMGGNESLSLSALQIGTVYLVRVYDFFSSTGTFSISLCSGAMLISSNSNSFCNTNTISITGNNQYSNYSWYRNNDLLLGEDSSTLLTSIDGNYYATASFGNCEVTSQTITLYPNMVTPNLGGNGIYLPGDLVNVGIPLTEISQTYTWKKNGSSVYGPVNGNGSNQSLFFNMEASRLGTYFVESNRSGCSAVNSGEVYVGYGGVDALTIFETTCSSVSFEWANYMNPVQRFQYAVTQNINPPVSGTVTSINDATVTGLLPGTSYYLHVRGARIEFLSLSNIIYSDNWVTIPFTTVTAPGFQVTAPVQNFCTGTTAITLTANVTGSSFEWFKNGDIILNENGATYEATTDGAYYATVVTDNCVQVSNTIFLNTQFAATPYLLSGSGVFAENALIEFEIDNTEPGTTYRLMKVGVSQPLDPPVNGNGTNQSINISMSSPGVAGTYLVQAERSGFCSSTSYNMEVDFGGVNGLKLDNCPFNAVAFSWTNYYNSVQRFRYILNNSPYPVGDADTTELNSASFNNLLPGTQYYIHVSGATIPDMDLGQIVYSEIWKTISFRTSLQPVSSNYCEWRGTVSTDWNNPANWACNILPQLSSSVLVPTGCINYPAINQSIQLKGLTVSPGATVTINNAATLDIVP